MPTRPSIDDPDESPVFNKIDSGISYLDKVGTEAASFSPMTSIMSLLLPLLKPWLAMTQGQQQPQSAPLPTPQTSSGATPSLFRPPPRPQNLPQDFRERFMFNRQNPDPGISPDKWRQMHSPADMRFHQELFGQIVRGLQGQQLPQGSPLQGMSKQQLFKLFLDLSWAPKTGI